MTILPRSAPSLTLGNFDRELSSGVGTCDLAALRFIDAYALVGTACALLGAIDGGVRPSIGFPTEEQMRLHLTRMGFADVLSGLQYDAVLPRIDIPERPDVLVPLATLSGELDVQRLTDLLWEQLRQSADPQILNATLEGLWELASNALEHSGAQAVVMGQVYKRGQPPHHHNRIQVAIGDAGKGIRGSFLETEHHQPDDDKAAIALSLEYLATSVDDPGRGQGLPSTMEQVTELKGDLVVRSGAAKITVGAGRGREETVPFLKGTIVCMSLPLYPWEAS